MSLAEGVGFSAFKRNLLEISWGPCWDTPLVMDLGVPLFKFKKSIAS